MKITRENIEAFFLDYCEGNLSAEDTAELMLFLGEHPDLDINLDDLTFPSLPSFDDNRMTAGDKEAMKKNDYGQGLRDDNVEDHIIARMEGLLSVEAIRDLETYIAARPEWQKIEKRYELTRLKADVSIQMPQRGALKKQETFVMRPFYYYAAAAAVILLALVFVPRNGTESVTPGLATVVTPAAKQDDHGNVSGGTEKNAPVGKNVEDKVIPQTAASRKVPAPTKTDGVPKQPKQKTSPPTIEATEKKDLFAEATPQPVNELPVQTESPTVPATEIPAENTPAVATQIPAENHTVRTENTSSLTAFLGKKVKKAVLPADEVVDGTIRTTDVVTALAQGAGKVLGKDVQAETKRSDEGEVSAFEVHIGKFGFSRTRN